MIIQPIVTVREVVAVAALIRGEATPEQQRLASEWLMREAARVTDLAYIDGPKARDTDTFFAAGRQYVGILWRQMLLPETLNKAKSYDKALAAGGSPAKERGNPE